MPNHRTYTDEQLTTAVAVSSSWADVMEVLGKPRSGAAMHVRKVANRLGLDTSHFIVRRNSVPVMESGPLPFGRPNAGIGSTPSLSIAMKWFLERGYLVSVPIEPAPYDLVTESDDGLKRIQVKTTSRRDERGGFKARLTRSVYVSGAKPNASGSYRLAPYAPGVIDYFFILVKDGSTFLIPAQVVEGAVDIALNRYIQYKIERD
jgi:hypothetical protein